MALAARSPGFMRLHLSLPMQNMHVHSRNQRASRTTCQHHCFRVSQQCSQVRIGRRYGQVCRRKLREHLVQQCAAAGVRFLAGEVSGVDAAASGASARVLCSSGSVVQTRWPAEPTAIARTCQAAPCIHDGCRTRISTDSGALVPQGGYHGSRRSGWKIFGVRERRTNSGSTDSVRHSGGGGGLRRWL